MLVFRAKLKIINNKNFIKDCLLSFNYFTIRVYVIYSLICMRVDAISNCSSDVSPNEFYTTTYTLKLELGNYYFTLFFGKIFSVLI